MHWIELSNTINSQEYLPPSNEVGCGKVLFSVMSVYLLTGGTRVKGSDSLCTAPWPLFPSVQVPLGPPLWHLVAKTGDLFKLVYLRNHPTDADIWHLKHVWWARGQYTSYWSAFLFLFKHNATSPNVATLGFHSDLPFTIYLGSKWALNLPCGRDDIIL